MGFTICTVNNILCPKTLDSSEEKLHMLIKKKPFNRVKKKKKWKKPQKEPQRRDPSSRTDRHAIDVACTEKSNKSSVILSVLAMRSSYLTIIILTKKVQVVHPWVFSSEYVSDRFWVHSGTDSKSVSVGDVCVFMQVYGELYF